MGEHLRMANLEVYVKKGLRPMLSQNRACGSTKEHEILRHFFIFPHGVRLGPLGTAATVWPIVPAPDDR
jgi:hypothetical protein